MAHPATSPTPPALLRTGTVRATIHYRFRDDKFVSTALGFLPTDFSLIRAIFVERYDEQPKRREERFQTRSWLKTTNPVLVWEGRKVMIELRMYGRTLDTGLAEIVLRSEMDRLEAERSKSIKKGKDDLCLTLRTPAWPAHTQWGGSHITLPSGYPPMSDEPEARAHALVERLLALLRPRGAARDRGAGEHGEAERLADEAGARWWVIQHFRGARSLLRWVIS